MRSVMPRIIVIAALASVLAACSGDDDTAETSTTTTAVPITTLGTTQAPPVTTAAPTTATTSTTLAALGQVEFPSYTIVSRSEGEAGDTVVVLIDPDFESLSDIDLQNVLADVVERFPPVFEAYVVSSQEAADLVLVDDVDTAGEAVLDQHFWARLEDGFRIVFAGPFAELSPLILGS